jgi:hypothetical protein
MARQPLMACGARLDGNVAVVIDSLHGNDYRSRATRGTLFPPGISLFARHATHTPRSFQSASKAGRKHVAERNGWTRFVTMQIVGGVG